MDRQSCKWVYIAGYGRSGSTWLELFLGSELQALCVGEIQNFFRRPMQHLSCSCGKSAADCAVWTPYAQEENLTSLVATLARNHRIVIDSSKTTFGSWTHFARLARSKEIELVPVIVFRHPARVHFSRDQGDNRLLRIGIQKPKRLQSVRMYAGWLSAYAIAASVCFLTRIQPIYINFDEFSSIQQAQAELNKRYALHMDQGSSEESQTFHIIEGNRHASGGLKPYEAPPDLGTIPLRSKALMLPLLPFYWLLRGASGEKK